MISQQELKNLLVTKLPGSDIPDATTLPEITVENNQYHHVAQTLKADTELIFNYLIDLTAVDRNDRFTIVLHLASTAHHHVVVLKTELTAKEKPEVDSVSDLWATAEFMEREVLDLFGIRFLNHPDPKRLFCEDDYGYPLRKDFRDEINMIER